MTTLARSGVCSFIILIYWCGTISAQVVNLPDPNLESAIREELSLPDEIPLTQQEMSRLTRLEAGENEIKDLTGLEHATNLKRIAVHQNDISDLKLLADLTQLERLSLWGNPISDLSPIADLVQLERLDLGGCQVSDITPLANLTQLTYLTLHYNFRIIDIRPLTNLTQLTELRLSRNRIVDISPLANLTQLTKLQLSHNRIVDVSPLANLTQLTDLTLANNGITDFRPLFGLHLKSVDIDIHKLQELAAVGVKIADPNLERSIREELGLPIETPFTQLVLNQLTELDAGNHQIEDLTGLEHATNLKRLNLPLNNISDLNPLSGLTNLENLHLWGNPISDLSPLSNLTNLKHLDLGGCQVSDITPLANLTKLTYLTLHYNFRIIDISPLTNLTQLTELRLKSNLIVDISPIASLIALEVLTISGNPISDYTPLNGLSLTYLERDEIREIPPLPIDNRIADRSFPSIFQAWNGISHHIVPRQDGIAYHDLYWHGLPFGVRWLNTDEGYTLFSYDIEQSIAERDELLSMNPNMLFLAEVRYRDAVPDRDYPEDFPYWVRDENGNLVRAWAENKLFLLDFTNPEFQDIVVRKVVAISKFGLFDGIVFDWWHESIVTLSDWNDWSKQYSTVEAELEARLSIVRRIREQVRDDFLIIGNTNRRRIPVTAPYLNGGYMETNRDYDGGYTYDGLMQIESSLLWLEENLKAPQVNCLEGWGVGNESPDSLNNKRWMRAITTLSLTHSNGYVMYNLGGIRFGVGDHEHIWHDFWDANLGKPIGTKAQLYQNIEGLFIREFTNGWAVYNRSGSTQEISLAENATGVASGQAGTTHRLVDLDGEIYLTTRSFADVNSDGHVNILDLIQVTNSLGKSAPDPNGDGVVNILDLVFVAQQLSQ